MVVLFLSWARPGAQPFLQLGLMMLLSISYICTVCIYLYIYMYSINMYCIVKVPQLSNNLSRSGSYSRRGSNLRPSDLKSKDNHLYLLSHGCLVMGRFLCESITSSYLLRFSYLFVIYFTTILSTYFCRYSFHFCFEF